MKISGKVYLIENNGEKINNIDTDMIFHNRYLHITDINEMGQYAFDNLNGWEDFSKRVEKNSILIVGENFGSGSSRQQAVDCFISLGVQSIIAESFGAIYKRNAINTGFPIIEAKGIFKSEKFHTYDEIEIDIITGEIKNLTTNKIFKAKPMSKVAMDIINAGGIFDITK